MSILCWLILGLITGFLFQGFVGDVSRSSCGPPRRGPYHTAWAVNSTCALARPGLVGTPALKQERDDPWRHTPPSRKSRTPRGSGGSVRSPSGRDRYPAQPEVWRVAR
jgi:hypothetical protein